MANGDRQLTPTGGNVNLLWTPLDCGLHMIDHNLAFDLADPDESMQGHVFHGAANDWTQEFRAWMTPRLRAAAGQIASFASEMPDPWTDIEHHVTPDRVQHLLWRFESEPANFWRLP